MEDLHLLLEASERTINIDKNGIYTQDEVDRIFITDEEDYQDSDEIEIE